MKFAIWLYRVLARAFPHEFKVLYGADVVQLGEDIVQDIAKENGFGGLVRLVADLAIRVPIEYLSEIRRDLGYALRTLSKSRGFAAVGIISLTIGIGISAVAVSEFLNLVLRDAPGVPDPGKLVMVNSVSYPYMERYRQQHDLFAGAAAFQIGIPYNVSLGNGAGAKAERVFGQLVSPEYFSVIGAKAARGRFFSPDVDKPGSEPGVVISDRFWREHMNSDPNAIGHTIRINGQTTTIIGIGAKDFSGVMPFIVSDIFVPTTAPASMAPELAGDVIHQRESKSFVALLRLAPGVSFSSAEAGVDAITRTLDQETLDPARHAKGRRVLMLPGGKMLPIPRAIIPVMFAFTIVLNSLIIAIACMNLANMQLARATARRREVAIRISVGASRFRLVRQLLTESTLLAFTGGAGGIGIAFWVASLLRVARLPLPFPVKFDITPDWRVIALVFGISLVAGIGFGLAPALASTKADLASSLKQGIGWQGHGHRRFGLRNLLMVGQLAGSLALLLITGFMVLGFQKTNAVEIPFDASTMYLMSIDPVRDGYSADRATSLFDGLADRLKRAPGVRDAVLTEAAPFGPQAAVFTMSVSGGTGPDQIVGGVAKNNVGPNYFSALSVPVLEGREFQMRDQRLEPAKGQAMPVVINQTAAAAFFASTDPIGRRILEASKSYEVVGVVKDLSAPLSENAQGQQPSVVPVVYLPLTKTDFAHPPASGMIVMVRSDRGPDGMEGVRRELASIDSNVAVFNVHTLSGQIADSMAYLKVSELVYGGIGVFGLVLAAIGLAGVTAYTVARRRKEIGIRMALGARKTQVMRLVLHEGGWLVIIGSVFGFLAATVLSRALSAFSSIFGPAFQATAHDPRLIVGAPLLLATLAMLACYLPARKSVKIDPLVALREE